MCNTARIPILKRPLFSLSLFFCHSERLNHFFRFSLSVFFYTFKCLALSRLRVGVLSFFLVFFGWLVVVVTCKCHQVPRTLSRSANTDGNDSLLCGGKERGGRQRKGGTRTERGGGEGGREGRGSKQNISITIASQNTNTYSYITSLSKLSQERSNFITLQVSTNGIAKQLID